MNCFVCGRSVQRKGDNSCANKCALILARMNKIAEAQMRKPEKPCLNCGKSFRPANVLMKACKKECKQELRYELDPNFQEKQKANRYGLTVAAMRNLFEAGCYAPGCTRRYDLQIDHDHSCCPGQKSCGKCVRGALCKRHNLYLGFIETDYLFAIWVLRQPHLILKGEWK